ncbi:MAG: hypothetical protein HY834_05340 [Devosia nanyangense]|uniref:Uncharacterized protein n=1 Tax=Devosia nanyangense TaxID=1228055 RepID=A0A933L0X1_9HYPH|nr:hypothetical protein [Devosia nanyangense]
MSNAHPGRIIPQDVEPEDGGGEMLSALPVSEAEIEELLYGDDRSAAERVTRLKELAAIVRDQQQSGLDNRDVGALLAGIEQAIAQLSDDLARDLDIVDDTTSMDDDPLGHRETLSPDSDELEEIEADDRASLRDGTEPLDDDALDPEQWDNGDGLNIDRGVN